MSDANRLFHPSAFSGGATQLDVVRLAAALDLVGQIGLFRVGIVFRNPNVAFGHVSRGALQSGRRLLAGRRRVLAGLSFAGWVERLSLDADLHRAGRHLVEGVTAI